MQTVINKAGQPVRVLEASDLTRWMFSRWTWGGAAAVLVFLGGLVWRLSATSSTTQTTLKTLDARVGLLEQTNIAAAELRKQVDSLRIDLRATVNAINSQLSGRRR